MTKFTISVLAEEGGQPSHLWTVQASTADDAMQIAFALDGGWSREIHDASEMLALAKSYCCIIAFLNDAAGQLDRIAVRGTAARTIGLWTDGENSTCAS